ncbi:class I SAM-dependent rRNA methyltransferase [Solitalea koreensis]|uniref:23S rRNA (Cytosine1962-C5)-methyltransferase n=1 Tax=Solitalea koreensis TaxID=543615 RepID=A0A521CHS0_9SPHI|nr:class I SAM-dependent rRNA methyltransferase [Solitalea koreensis]SMO58250.1 23S rRNA (cytosine1962-C5)-methyltransferase [Solitalea koreensis]
MKSVRISKGKEKAVKNHHPWVFSGAINSAIGQPNQGEVVKIINSADQFLAYGYYNKSSKITVRAIEWNEETKIDDNWWKDRITQAITRRKSLLTLEDTDSVRLIYSEADGIPGLIVDKYADFLVMQVLTAGVELQKKLITDHLYALLKPKGIFERSDAKSRSLEGLKPSNGLLAGEMPPELLEINENGLTFLVNIADGQKSGYFLDQRENRKIAAKYAKGLSVLDCFCYSGGFSLNAHKAGAKSIVSIDSSALAIKTVKQNYKANQITFNENDLIEADVNATLRRFQTEKREFDFIILDPPKLAPTRATVDKAQRAYKDLNLQALKLLQPGGLLATFSCSGGIDIDLFKQIISWAALDAGKELQIIEQFNQPSDHPIRTSFPESEYLKGLLCRVI